MLTDAELSALVAEKVMGWRKPSERGRCDACGWPVQPTLDLGCTADTCSMVKMRGPRADEPAEYAIDAGLALEAAMKADGERYRIHLSGVGSRHVCSVGERFGVFGSTPARALSLAALRASGVEVTDDD